MEAPTSRRAVAALVASIFSSIVCVVASGVAAPPAQAAQIIHADGRRETVQGLRRGGDGRYSFEKEGRRTFAQADVVAVTDDSGATSETIAALSAAALSPEIEAALAAVSDTKNGAWLAAAESVVSARSRAVHDSLVALTKLEEKESRRRGVVLLVRLLTKESALAAARAVLVEPDKKLRREGASALFSVREILLRSDSKEVFEKGLADSDRDTRVIFALLAAPGGTEKALALLRDEGLPHPDHHFREDAAMALGRQGDPAGEKILISLLSRKHLPGVDDPRLAEQLLVAEQVELCSILGRLGTEKGRAALEKAAKSKHEEVRAAAQRALAPAEGGPRDESASSPCAPPLPARRGSVESAAP